VQTTWRSLYSYFKGDDGMKSECCGAYNSEYEDFGICPECKEHCDFIEEDEPEDDKLSPNFFDGLINKYNSLIVKHSNLQDEHIKLLNEYSELLEKVKKIINPQGL